jgi:hypothetical protein
MIKLDTKLVYETPLFVGQGIPSSQGLIVKVYEGIHTLPSSGLELAIS